MKLYANRNGFTMIEVIAVLVIMGIIASVAVSRFFSNQNGLIVATDTLTANLRLTQSRAMNTSINTDASSVVWGVRFVSTTQYHLFYCADASACDPANAANQRTFPGASNIMMDLSQNNVHLTSGNGVVLAFNRFGTPCTNAALTSILAQPLGITLQDNNGNNRTINITPQTGMITP